MPYFGKYRGIVVDVNDPERRGRVLVRVPSISGTAALGWAESCFPPGIFDVPSVGAAVYVEFEEGDVNFPVWVGLLPTNPYVTEKFIDTEYDPATRKYLIVDDSAPSETNTYSSEKIEDLMTSDDAEIAAIAALAEGALQRGGGTMTGELGAPHLTYGQGYASWTRSYTVNVIAPLPLVHPDGVNLLPAYSYRCTAVVNSTGTATGAVVLFLGDGSGFTMIKVFENGNTSNHPEFFMNAGVPSIRLFDHTSNYPVRVMTEMLPNRGRAFSDLAIVAQDAALDEKVPLTYLVERNFQTVNLIHGLNMINAAVSGPLDLVIKGRTLVNLLGSLGSFELDVNANGIADGWLGTLQGSTATLETSSLYGTKAQRITSTAVDVSNNRRIYSTVNVTVGKYYLAMVRATTDGVATADVVILDPDGSNAYISAASAVGGIRFVKFTPVASGVAQFRVRNAIATPSVGWTQFDGARLYEISATDYAAIGTTITATSSPSIEDVFPYVDRRQHLSDIGIIKYGKNLIKPFQQWDTIHASMQIVESNNLMIPANTSGSPAAALVVPVYPNTDYTLSRASGGGGRWKVDGSSTGAIVGNTSSTTVNFNSGNNASVTVSLDKSSGTLTQVNFVNVQLELGSVATTWEPRNDDMSLAPGQFGQIGDVYDSYEFATGTYTERIKKGVVLDGSLAWVYRSDYTGFKSVDFPLGTAVPTYYDQIIVVKHDGRILNKITSGDATSGDTVWTGSSNALRITVSDSDSGWIESLNPNNNAVKALMNGWKANGNNGTVYNSWVSVLDGVTAPGTNSETFVAANKAPGWTGYATLDYALTTTAAPVVMSRAYNAITLHSGANMIEVMTGVVSQDTNVPKLSVGRYYINNIAVSSQLSSRLDRFIEIYRNGDPDKKWTIQFGHPNAFGNYHAHIAEADFDTTAVYPITFVKLDRYLSTTNVVNATAKISTTIGSSYAELVKRFSDAIENQSKILNLLNIHAADNVAHHMYAENTAANDTYAITIPGINSYAQIVGKPVIFKATVANTGAATLSINGLSGQPIYRGVTTALITGDIPANKFAMVVHDGTNWQLLSQGADVVQESAVQTLTNKTITSAIIDTGFRGSYYFHRYFNNVTTSAVANQKIDLHFAVNAAGTIDISIVGNWNGGNSNGFLRKRISFMCTYPSTIHSQYAKYEEAFGLLPDFIAISDLTYDSTNSRFRIQIVIRNPVVNTYNVNVVFHGLDATNTANLYNNLTLGSFYTTDTTVFAKPVAMLWSEIDKTGSSLSHLADRSATALTGTLPAARISSDGSVVYSADVIPAYHGRARSNLGSPTIADIAVTPAQMTNKTQFHPINKLTFEYTTDGTTWNTWVLSDALKKVLVTHPLAGSVSITNGWNSARITIEAVAYNYLSWLYLYTATQGHTMYVRIETSVDGTTWTDRVANSGTISTWPGHTVIPHASVAHHPTPTPGSHIKYVRINFVPTWSATYPLNDIVLYAFEYYGGYPAGRREIYNWDYDKNVTFPAKITAPNFGDASLAEVNRLVGLTSGAQSQLDSKAAKTTTVGPLADLNTITTSGFYRLQSSHPNSPSGSDYGQLIVSRGGDTIAQIIIGYNTGSPTWIRSGSPTDVGGGGTWGTWKKVAFSELEASIAPTLQNSWINYGGTYRTAGYYKDAFGIVCLEGMIKNGATANGTVIFNLNVGYRPSSDIVVATVCTGALALLSITSAGDVTTFGVTGSTYLSLDGISFPAR